MPLRIPVVLVAIFFALTEPADVFTSPEKADASKSLDLLFRSQGHVTKTASRRYRDKRGGDFLPIGMSRNRNYKNSMVIDEDKLERERQSLGSSSSNHQKRDQFQKIYQQIKKAENGVGQDELQDLSLVPERQTETDKQQDYSHLENLEIPNNNYTDVTESEISSSGSCASYSQQRYDYRLEEFHENHPGYTGRDNIIDNICEIKVATDEESDYRYTTTKIVSDHRDKFNCTKCLCQYIDPGSSRHHHVDADCTDRNLRAIPTNLPGHTFNLDVSRNVLSAINLGSVFSYRSLHTLRATDCKIDTISNSTTGVNPSLNVLDLKYNFITRLYRGVFAGFPNLKWLYLTGNCIQSLHPDFFLGVSPIWFIDLALNDLRSIDGATFHNLTFLKGLTLSTNPLLGYDVFTGDLFKNLKRLKTLKIQGSSNGATNYPDRAIGMLENLEDLNIDALAAPAEFGSEFSQLQHLKILSFGPFSDCRLVNMSASFFRHFGKLRCLYIHSCNISYLNPEAYGSLHSLRALTINSVPSMTLDKAFEDLVGFQNKTPLEYIGFNNLTNWYWPCIWLTDRQGKFMKGLNLTTINLGQNRLSLLADNFIETFPMTVEKLMLRGNKFTLMNPLWTSLKRLTKLSYLDLSWQNMERRNFYVPLLREREDVYPTVGDDTYIPSTHHDQHSLVKRDVRQANQSTSDEIRNDFILDIPVNLEYVIAPWYHSFGNILFTNPIGENKLKLLNFSRSGLNHWGEGRLPKEVERLDVSINAATSINHDFFHPNNSLTELRIQVNFLGDFIGGSNGSVFRYLKSLRYVDLSTNVIFGIPFDFFNGLTEVESIILADNRLEVLNVSFELTQNLNFLDLHKNSLSWISETTRDHIDKLSAKPGGIVVDLHYNSMMCTCDTIDMLHWMAVSNAYFLNIGLYTCKDSDKNLVNITSRDELRLQVARLRRSCTSYGYLIFGVIAIILVFVITLVAGICYRNRWWIRYKKNVLFAKWFGFKPSNAGNSDLRGYKYDAFLLYVSEDRRFAYACRNELEVTRNHKLCIGDRDILPGTSEIEAIVSAVQNSRITLVVVSDEFVFDMNNQFRENPMMNYALQMALMEEYCTKRRTLHVIENTTFERVKYPPFILKVFHDGHRTQFPSDQHVRVTDEMRVAFWDSLSEDIGHSTRCPDAGDDAVDHSFCFHSYSYEESGASNST